MQPNDSSFWQYQVYADGAYIGGDSQETDSNDSSVIENVDFQSFRTLHFQNL